jgi:glycine oxidase
MSSAGTRSVARPDDVLVVGGGVIGLSIAEAAARAGMRVRLLEAEGLASGASGAAAGMLAPISESHGDPRWLELGLASLLRFEALCARLLEETGVDPELEASGLLRLLASESQRDAIRARFGELAAASGALGGPTEGLLEWLDEFEVLEQEPELSAGFVGAFRSPLECHLRPPLLAEALAVSARRQGVEIETGVRVGALSREGGRVVGVDSSAGGRAAGAVVVAAGPWTLPLLEASGIRPREAAPPAVEPVRGQILSLWPSQSTTRQIVWAQGAYFVPKRDGSLVVGATEERVGFDRAVTAEGVSWLLERAQSVFPGLALARFDRVWAGLRPVSRDAMPFLGGVPGCEGLLLAVGHGRNGVLLSPLSAELIRDALLGRGTLGATHPCSPARAFEA